MNRALRVTALLLAAAGAVHAQMEQPGQRELDEARRKRDAEPSTGTLTRPPRLVHQVPVPYPDAARALKQTGTVVLRLTVDADGRVSRVDVIQSAGPVLDQAAMGAVSGFLFEPAQVDGENASVQVDWRQVFELREEVKQVPVAPPPNEEEEADVAPQAAEPAAPEETPVNFLGMVRESGTKAPLADAEVTVVPDTGEPITVATDRTGRFRARGVPPGEWLVRVSATGYEQMATTERFGADEQVRATYYIPRKSYNKFETVIRDRRATKEVTRVELRREEVSQIPGTFGDPLRAIENLPGMARSPLLGGQLLVRGASPQSTGVYMDGVEIPLLYHFGGLTSVVNAEFLESIDFYPGGFGPRYGRATAGIVDVRSRKLAFDDYRGAVKIDLFDSGFFFGGSVTPFGEPKGAETPDPRRLSFGFAARRSYIDAVIPLVLSAVVPAGAGAITVAPVYWDYQAKLEYRPITGHQFQLFAFGSDDLLKVIASGVANGAGFGISSHTQFHRVMGRWTWRLAPRLQNVFQAHAGADLTNLGIGGGGFSVNNDVLTQNVGLRNDLHYDLSDFARLHAGMDVGASSTRLESDLLRLLGGNGGFGPGGGGGGGDGEGGGGGPFGGEGIGRVVSIVEFPRTVSRPVDIVATVEDNPPATEDSVRVDVAPWVEAEIGPFLGITVTPGMRLDWFAYGTVNQFYPQPRLNVRWEPLPGTLFKGVLGEYTQAPEATEVSPNTGNTRLFPVHARHHVLGIEQRLTPFLGISMNAFLNERFDQVAPSARYSISNGVAQLERYANSSRGRAYGVDFMLRHDLSESFFGWISYTLSRSENQAKPNADWRTFQYDQTHILTLVGQYKLPWHLPFREWSRTGRLPRGVFWNTGWSILSGDVSVGGRFRYVTGNPASFYSGSVNDLDRDQWLATGQRQGRLPPFHQLDVRVDYKMAFESWLVDVYLDLINAYNRENPEAIQWDYRYQGYSTISLLPLLPIFGVTAEF